MVITVLLHASLEVYVGTNGIIISCIVPNTRVKICRGMNNL